MYTQRNCLQNEWRNSAIIPVFKKSDRKPLITTDELVFLTPVIRHPLKSLIKNCKVSRNSFCQKHKMDCEWDLHVQMQNFDFNY